MNQPGAKPLNIQQHDEKHDGALKTSLQYDPIGHTKYCLLQIENEITSILIKSKDNQISNNSKTEIRALLKEANVIIDLNITDKSTTNELSILKFRHHLRKLFLSPIIQTEMKSENEEEYIYDILINKLNIRFDHLKPTYIVTKTDDESKYETSKDLKNFNIDNELKFQLKQCHEAGDICKFGYISCLCIICLSISTCP